MFQVNWSSTALNELAAVWTGADASTRRAITAAAQAIDGQLRNQPGKQGESRDEGVRIDFSDPLGLLFEIDERLRTVTILHVWNIRRRS
jgi:hypothetical protein